LNDLTVQQFMYKSEGYGEKSGCEMLDYEFSCEMLPMSLHIQCLLLCL